jgi:uracil-DNA glycosylase
MSEPAAAGLALDRLIEEIRACRLCRDQPVGVRLGHEPRPVVRLSATARILVCGQAPGTRVHASGLPFDDASGQRLRSWMGVDRATFYDAARIAFLPMGFCFPGHDRHGGDLPPRRECAPQWRARVLAELSAVRLILLVGQHAQRWHLGPVATATLTTTVRDWRLIATPDDAGVQRMVLPHPSWRNTGWLKRNSWFAAEVIPELQHQVRVVLD